MKAIKQRLQTYFSTWLNSKTGGQAPVVVYTTANEPSSSTQEHAYAPNYRHTEYISMRTGSERLATTDARGGGSIEFCNA